ncbi:MAG: N(4)-(beta-N-acetylglucosaminyl)-L-asparaginase [Planctomycetota bacterium]
MMSDVSRRLFMHAAGVAAMAVGATAKASGERQAEVRVISSGNGAKATEKAYQMIIDGSDALDAVVAGVAIVEDDPEDTSVGYGGLPNERGVVELDAAVMHGPTHHAGAVASLQNIRHPAQVALKVLRRSDHVLLVGAGALDFAKAHGFQEENLLTDFSRRIWLRWKEMLSEKDDWIPDPNETNLDNVAEFFQRNSVRTADGNGLRFRRPTGTIHCSGLAASGDMSCTTTTSGMAFKIPGRVGDSPIIGAGLYVDNEVGSCGSTGRGEANLQNLSSFAAVELMRNGASPEEAGMEILRRVAKTTETRLRNQDGRPDFGLSFYVMAKDGRYAGVTMWGPGKFAVTDSKGTRLEDMKSLYQKPV